MEYKLLGVNTSSFINIGDYIQALASSQFYPKVDGFIQREGLKEYKGGKVATIMNGWYMHNPIHWPPSPSIIPLFVAFHINTSVKDQMLNVESIQYLKKYEPIGCRDLFTVNCLKSKGIDAYFSGCMTLTLGYKYKSAIRNSKIYFVDPYVSVDRNPLAFLKHTPYLLKKLKRIYVISKKWYRGLNLQGIVKSTLFLKTYSQLFNEDLLVSSEFISQAGTSGWPNDENELLNKAEDLVRQYSQAGLVITSRIHCALPCLGLETPVLFTMAKDTDEFSACRFGGLKDLFNIIEYDDGSLKPKFDLNGKITLHNRPENKQNWRPLANALIDRCKKFFTLFEGNNN